MTSMDRKREGDTVDGLAVPVNKITKTEQEKSSFEKGTTEVNWGPESEKDKYIVRFIYGETCCESPWGDAPDWPSLTYKRINEDEDGEEYASRQSVIAALWIKESGEFIAYWGVDDDDGHVDFFCKEGLKGTDGLDMVSGVLCTELCPELIDVFDDGSGKDREPTFVPSASFDVELLNKMYLKQEAVIIDAVVPKKVAKQSSFEVRTVETEWGPAGQAGKYIIRHVHGENCGNFEWSRGTQWPYITYVKFHEDYEEEYLGQRVFGAVWLKASGELVAIWGTDDDDCHAEFFCKESYADPQELENLSHILCTDICPGLVTLFEGESGTNLSTVFVPDSCFDARLLNNLYVKKK
jgi:hypothetical protein